MGISRSGSTVVAYAMKKQHWPLDVALAYVKDRRSVVKPNDGFMKQLQLYNGILNARSDPQLWRWWPTLIEYEFQEYSLSHLLFSPCH